jgi:transcription antitermination factor NusG
LGVFTSADAESKNLTGWFFSVGENQRGEALPATNNQQSELSCEDNRISTLAMTPQWYVLWTHSHCEQQVHDQLSAKGYHSFLPRISRWSQRGGVRYLASVPMFPGYLFLRHAIDKLSYIDVCSVRGLVSILGQRWDRLAPVPDHEIESIQQVVAATLPVMPHSYLQKGQRVRVNRGPLMNAEGILLKTEAKTGLLVLSVDLLQRSVAVRIDCTMVSPL